MHKLSPTQINNYRRCKRIPSWQFVRGLRSKSGKGAELGERVHKRLEAYLAGEKPDYVTDKQAQEILDPALPFLPKPGEGKSEQTFTFEWGGLTWTGRIDAQTDKIYDLKTTKEAKYAKDAVQLSFDPQGIIYSKAYDGAKCTWVYTLTKGGPGAWPVSFTPQQSGPVVDAILADGIAITDIVQTKKDPLAIPASRDGCHAFGLGSCSYYWECKDLSPFRGIERVKEQVIPAMSLLSKLSKPAVEERAAPNPVDAMVNEMAKGFESVLNSAINPPESADAGDPPPPPTEKPKRTRKAKAQPTEPGIPANTEVSNRATDENMKPTTASSVPPSLETSRHTSPLTILCLFVNCRPIGKAGNEVLDISVPITKVKDELRADGVGDYRFLDFGEGQGILASKTMAILAATEESERGELMIFVDSQLPESKILLGELRSRAIQVIEGT